MEILDDPLANFLSNIQTLINQNLVISQTYINFSQRLQGVFWKSVGRAEMGLFGAIFVKFWTDFRQPGAQKSPTKGGNPPIGGKKYTLGYQCLLLQGRGVVELNWDTGPKLLIPPIIY